MKLLWNALLLTLVLCAGIFAPAALAKAIDTEEFYVYFEGDCNVRNEPGLDGDVMGTYKTGETAMFVNEASIDERGVRWYLVVIGDNLGWASSRYATLTNGEISPVYYEDEWEMSAYYEMKDEHLLMREPDENSAVLDTLEAGDHATDLGYFYFDDAGESWYYVTYAGQAGWIEAMGTIGVAP